MSFKKRPLAILVAASSVALTGCSSGGGGGHSQPDPGGTHQPQPQPQPQPEKSLETVTVGVVDTGFDLAALSSPEKVLSTENLLTGGTDVSRGNIWHGGVVTETVTESRPNNTNVRLYQAGDTSGLSQSNAVNFGLAKAATDGARVVNASYAGRMYSSDPRLEFNGETAATSYQKIISSNDGKGAVYTLGAGNGGTAIPPATETLHFGELYQDQPELWNMLLIAVGSTDNGNAIHPQSSYPGDNQHYQERALASDYVNSGVAQGTSVSTARISAYAAGVIGMWPHLAAPEVSQLLLDTADKSSPLYNQHACGATGTMNCGFYYLGQGEADIDAALAPQGSVNVAVADRVDGESHAADASFVQLSAAYGDSLASSGVLEDVAVFDALGRDYRMDLSGSAQPSRSFDRELLRRMGRMTLATDQTRYSERVDLGSMHFQSQFDGTGQVISSRFDGHFDKAALTAFSFQGGDINPLSAYAESSFMPMLSFQGGTELTQNVSDVTGVRAGYQMGDRFSVTATHWVGSTQDQQSASYDYSTQRSDMGFNFDATPAVTLQANVGVLNESGGLLGANSGGALSFGSNTLSFAGIGFDASVSKTISAFGHFEAGMGSANSDGLMTSINDIRTQDVALGLQWTGDEHAAAFTIRQPVRLEAGVAHLDVPVGRTVDGAVMTEQRQASLSPSGRQIDVEVGYGFKPSANAHLQMNLLHTLDPGHNSTTPSDTALMTTYQYAW